MISVRVYSQEDAENVGRLIADTYSRYNLSYLPLEERGPYLGPFKHATSPEPAHKAAIADVIRAVVVLVAENEGGEIVGVLRGKQSRLQSLFVRGDHHRKNAGRALVGAFESWCRQQY